MPRETSYRVGSAAAGDMGTYVEEITIDTEQTEGAQDQDETYHDSKDWAKFYGYYLNIPECKIATDTLARWDIGDGYIAGDSRAKIILDGITGSGNETFDDILENMDRVCSINGDSFAEVIRDDDGELINLKVLDPSSMRIVVGKNGLIKRYEQITKINGKENKTKFAPNEIFHLTNNRIADNIGGVSDYRALEKIIKASNSSFEIQTQIIKHFSKPKLMVEIDSDDPARIQAFMQKFDEATNTGDNLGYPKGTINPQVLAVPPNGTMNVLSWREHVKNYFYQVVGIPQILMGSASEFSESSAKIALTSFTQVVKRRQRYIITQVWSQLYLRIDLDPPVSIINELISDTKKDGGNQMQGFQANDVIAGRGE